MKILVTGASGLFGRTVAQTLLDRGDDVTVFQRKPAGLQCREILGDITHEATVARAAVGSDAIIHLAARVSPTGSQRVFDQINVHGSVNVMAAARRAKVPKLVYVSSPAVTATGKAQVGVDTAPADPKGARTNYARSKAKAELAMLAADDSSLSVVAVRPHLVWGPGDEQLVARVIERARKGQLRIIGNGAALVDTTFVDNAADAVVAAADHAHEAHGQALVVSNGEPRPVIELLRGITTAAGVDPPTRYIPMGIAKVLGAGAELAWATLRLQSDPPMTRFLAEQLGTAHWYDQRRTRELLHWKPKICLAEGFDRLATYYRNT